MPVTFSVSFYDKWKKKWKTYEIVCEDLTPEDSVEDKAECIADKLAESWANAYGVEDKYMILNYKKKMYDLISHILENEKRRKKIALLTTSDNPEVQKKVVILSKIKLAETMKGRNDRILGMNSKNLVFLETDRRTKNCFQHVLEIAYRVTNIIHEKVACNKIIAYITQHGYHYIIPCSIRKDFCCDIYQYIRLEYDGDECLDMKHVIMSIKRGYTTLSVKPTRRKYIKVEFDRQHGIATVFTNSEQLYEWVAEVFNRHGFETIMIEA